MKKIIFILFLGAIFSGFTVSKKIEKLISKQIKSVFKIENYTKEPIFVSNEINNTLPIQITENNFFKISNANQLLGYYYFGKAFGKADYFDFIVIFDKNLTVSKIKILVYREDRGGEIGSKRWLRQFIGKSKGEFLKYQKDIAAISGATISVKSMTTEVNKILKTVGILYTKKQL